MNNKQTSILVVDDEQPIRKMLVDFLGRKHLCIAASSAEEATRILALGPANLVLTDISMPGASGLELCESIQQAHPEAVVIMMSGNTEIDSAIKAMRHGAFDYITKPFDLQQVTVSVERALRFQELVVAKRRYEASLEETVFQRTQQLRSVNQDLNQTLEVLYSNYRATLRALAEALEARDCETRGHSDRVVAYCLRLGRELGLAHSDLIRLEQGALLHDIGKIGVPDAILLKRGGLSDEEWTEMRLHIAHGLRIIDRIDFLSGARPVVGQHHEKFDGSGYPAGLRGNAIHVNARIFAVADAFDAITSDRPYRQARSYAEARDEIIACADSHFDPQVVKGFLRVPESEWAEICRTAVSRDYLEQIIDKHEIRAFIVSLKSHRGATGPLRVPLNVQDAGLTSMETKASPSR
ncbi:MAG: HD domain-containing phosphohydrolase [Acidobacteriota bacterium]